jgi:hypothetical protein
MCGIHPVARQHHFFLEHLYTHIFCWQDILENPVVPTLPYAPAHGHNGLLIRVFSNDFHPWNV